jgi:hypothetical protein
MELFVALLTFLGVAVNLDRSASANSISLSKDDASKIYNSSEYKSYLKNGGTDVFDFEGTPAVHVIIEEDDEKE